jgi:hypothetical protein
MILAFVSCNSDSSDSPGDNKYKSPNADINKFLFVGIADKTPSLYLYDLSQNKYKRFWYQPRENVIDLSVSPDFQKAFFVTALSVEEGGSLPLIRKVKLYLIDLVLMKITHIKKYGNAGQIITNWEDENNFKIVINTFDKIIATDINQTTQLYNSFGKLLVDESKTFDLLKDGYPALPKPKRNYESPSGEYYLQLSGDRQFFLLNERRTNQQDTIKTSKLLTNQFAWSYNEKYLAVNFVSGNSVLDTSSILVYSLSNKKVQKEWKGNGIKNFYLLNKLLIFDNGIGQESELIIYNCGTNKVINKIRIKGGCGLKNIPGIRTYDVVE